MDEIMISKKWVVAVRVVIGLGAGLLWGVPKVLGRDQAEISASPTQQPAQERFKYSGPRGTIHHSALAHERHPPPASGEGFFCTAHPPGEKSNFGG
ncbi:MAG: hypothetical protein MUC85_10980 [Anaerolineales bacterium]|nr:hypothetical protein [Anaerolineales bacterium]